MNLTEQPTIQREIQHPTHDSVPEIGLRYAITMSEKDALSLDFNDGFFMDLNSNRFRKEITICKVMVSLQQMDFTTRLD